MASAFSHGRLWRIFAAITFLNQVIRVPLLLSVATSVGKLEAYFIIAATSIPVQFIAQEVLQFRSRRHGISAFERVGMPLFAAISIAYVAWHHGRDLGVAYLLFALAILFHGAAIGRLRDVFPAPVILATEAVYNTAITVLAIVSVVIWRDSDHLGHAIVLAQAGAAVLVGTSVLMACRRRQQPSTATILPSTDSSTGVATSIVLAGIMATTQLERLVIAAAQPAALACISLAAGVTQAWRKIGMDDALVFQRLREADSADLFPAIAREVRHARRLFYPPLVVALLALVFIGDIGARLQALGILRSLTTSDFALAASILCIYLSVMPPAIVMINALRQRAIPIGGMAWGALVIVALIELAVLTAPLAAASMMNVALVMIALTASLSHALLLTLCRNHLRLAFKLVSPDLGVFLLVISLLLWMLAH